MQTHLAEFVAIRPEHAEFDSILRSCVHCGFCNATCPTYLLLGDELDGPRGRIYLIKQALEGRPVSRLTQRHLDRCLNCRACETTCPSGVRYGRLLDLGRVVIEEQVPRSGFDRLRRLALRQILPYRGRFEMLVRIARLAGFLLPNAWRIPIPACNHQPAWPSNPHPRQMLVLEGCVQPVLAPRIDRAVAVVLDKLGISLKRVAGSACCGALPYHLSAHDQARDMARCNIDACWPLLEQGAEAVISTASGCGVFLKDYAALLQHDPAYRDKASRFAASVKDISEVLTNEDLSSFTADHRRIAFQSPCTLQHGQRLNGRVEALLHRIGFQLTAQQDAHLCCGSAGVYSVLEAPLSHQLKQDKLGKLQAARPDVIATANIGCLAQLQSGTSLNVLHWIELLTDE